jgi:hydroxymethylglutaryl-CoA lyase
VIRALVEAGVREMEATSFVSPKAVPQMRDAAQVMAALPRGQCTYCALVPNLKGAQLALEAGADRLGVFISASEKHNQANVRRSISDSLADLAAIFHLARERGVPVEGAVSVAFGCPYQGDVPHQDVFRVVESFLEQGAELVLLADTTGMATPNRVEALLEDCRKKFPQGNFGLHLHNNRGTAMTNLFVALQMGVTVFDTALGGIGGCPNVPQAAGNLPTEDVVYLLEEMGVATGIDLVAVIRAAHLLEKILGRTLPGQVMKSGPRDPELAAQVCGIGHDVLQA